MILPEPQINLPSTNTTYRYKIDTGTPQQASETQYPLLMAEFTRKVIGANSVCDVFTFGVSYHFSGHHFHMLKIMQVPPCALVIASQEYAAPKLGTQTRLSSAWRVQEYGGSQIVKLDPAPNEKFSHE